MEEPQSPQQDAYNRKSGRTVSERRQDQANKAVSNAYRTGQLSAIERDLHRRLSSLEGWKANLQGQNGVNVNDNIISLDARSLRPPVATAAQTAGIEQGDVFVQPFWIIPQSANPDEPSCHVNPYSVLLEDPSATSSVAIANLTAAFTPLAGDWAWLEISVDPTSGAVTGASLQIGGTWADYPQFYALNGSDEQTTAYCPIAQFASAIETDYRPGVTLAGGSIQVIQLCNTHLMMTALCTEDGKSIRIPMPSAGGAIS